MGSIFSVRNVEIDEHVIKLKPLNESGVISIHKKDNENKTEQFDSKYIELSETIIEEAKIKAMKIIDEAEKEAKKIKNETIEKSKKEGYIEGYKEGIKTGTSDVYAKYKDLIKKSEDDISNIIKYRENLFEDIEGQAIDLALLISRKILNYEIDNNHNVMHGILNKVIKDYVKTGNEKIYVSMKNKYILTKNNELLENMFNNEMNLNIIDSMDVNDTECVVENDKGKLDIGIDSQYEQISSALFNAVKCF